MSQVKLTLRPPPNVDFVHGYPGIPPGGPDRPQAAVKGAIEVRVGQQGVKAKWVRIELRKVETLPGGGPPNTFYDFVGPSPVNLWTSSDEYGLLKTQDFPFSIRIPESIPPSIALENRAGIQYELVASVCTKGKRGFFRKRKSTVSSTQAPIIIDKHELHSTWPVYSQNESRSVVHDGVTLTVERKQACYGPGDRVSVVATVKSDSLNALILRGFDLSLRETTVFSAGHFTSKKTTAPPPKKINIAESKLPVNINMYGGTQHRAELACQISPDHTTTSLNAARHIDITYILCVKALIDTMGPIILELPVIVSNWQRNVSYEAIRRIGPAPSLSLLPITTPPPHAITRVDPAPAPGRPAASTMPSREPNIAVSRSSSATAYNSLPAENNRLYHGNAMKIDELGYGAGLGFGARPTHSISNSITSSGLTDEHSSRSPISPVNTTSKRPNSATNKFTITNTLPGEIPHQEDLSRSRSASGGGSNPQRHWPTAEEEKQRLYDAAREKVEQVQGSVARVTTPPPSTVPTKKAAATPTANSPSKTLWPTAEDEKERLFLQAQAAVAKTQGLSSYSPPSSLHGRSNSDLSRMVDLTRAASGSRAVPTNTAKSMTPAALYSEAMAAKNSHMAKQTVTPPKASPKVSVPYYPTAEEEKAALRRYEQAKQAVDRVQGFPSDGSGVNASATGAGGPIAYESLYPNETRGDTSSPAPRSDLPPPFEAHPAVLSSHLSEKERFRRAYELQDAAAMAPQNHSPPQVSRKTSEDIQALSEKEKLRRKFEAQDAEGLTAAHASPPQPPPRTFSSSSQTIPAATRHPRPTPAPPSSPGKIMTAAEEKALLKAQYAAEDAQIAKPHINGLGRPGSSAVHHPPTPPSPPPLMPRPPAEYIQETQEEDARVSRFAANGILPPLDDGLIKHSPPALGVPPFTPFTAGFEAGLVKLPGPPPPLPPKPEGD